MHGTMKISNNDFAYTKYIGKIFVFTSKKIDTKIDRMIDRKKQVNERNEASD
jgi:hypothetical protein